MLVGVQREGWGAALGQWHERHWEANLGAPGRREQRGGAYRAYEPPRLCTWPVLPGSTVAALAADAEREVRALSAGPEVSGLEGLARFLLRSEAIASSRIEGLEVSPQQLAIAELAQIEDITGRSFSENARLVANNVTLLRDATSTLAGAEDITQETLDLLHRALLDDPALHGLRAGQNWLGGSDWHPLDAEFVPPPPELVPELMDDLAAYASGATHSPLVQAGLVHAQFETIHPYRDGNGRVGRALIHTILRRRGLTPSAILPVSLVLLTRADDYVSGLNAYRFDGPADGEDGRRALDAWLEVFLSATIAAADQATRFAAELADLRAQWTDRLSARRTEQGTRGRPRANSATARLIERLPELPLFSVQTVHRTLGVSDVAARAAAEELAEAGIVTRRAIGAATGYFATEVFDLLTLAERRLASTRWDTRDSPPNRRVPALPE